jgi:hypothetical protein
MKKNQNEQPRRCVSRKVPSRAHFWRQNARHCVRGHGLPFKFIDGLGDAVPNSYPKLDLLWDNVIAGLPSWPR